MDNPEAVKETIGEAISGYFKETRGNTNTKEEVDIIDMNNI